MMWSVLLIFALTLHDFSTPRRLWYLVLVAAAVQVPVCAFQYIVIGGRLMTTGKQGWDAVSGTMGGSESGGGSAALAFLMVAALLVALALWRKSALKLRYLLLAAASCFLVLAVSEVKAAVLVFLPLGLLLIYRRWALQRPGMFVVLLAGIGLLVTAFFFAYGLLHYQRAAGGGGRTPMAVIQQALTEETQASQVGLHTYDLGRTALLVFWATEHQRSGDWATVMFGHGPASTKIGRFSVGAVARQYPAYRLQKSAASILLWEFGVLGLTVFLALLIGSAMASFRQSSRRDLPAHDSALLEAGGVLLILFASSVFYSRFVLDTPAMTLLAMLCMGQLALWRRFPNLPTFLHSRMDEFSARRPAVAVRTIAQTQ